MESVATLAGPRVHLRRLAALDTPHVMKWRNDPEIVGQFFHSDSLALPEHEAFLQALADASDRQEFVIVENASNRPVGQIGLKHINQPRGEGELSVLIGESDVRGKGLAYEASSLLVNYAFQQLTLRRVTLSLFAQNSKALRLYAKLGFEEVSEVASTWRKNGEDRSTLVMALDNPEQCHPPKPLSGSAKAR